MPSTSLRAVLSWRATAQRSSLSATACQPSRRTDGQAWDAVALARYTSRQAFADMVANPEYRDQAGPMRQSALIEAVLQPIQTVSS